MPFEREKPFALRSPRCLSAGESNQRASTRENGGYSKPFVCLRDRQDVDIPTVSVICLGQPVATRNTQALTAQTAWLVAHRLGSFIHYLGRVKVSIPQPNWRQRRRASLRSKLRKLGLGAVSED
jgi:hypothetical protein